MSPLFSLRSLQDAWDAFEPPVLRFLMGLALALGALVATPFVLLALTFSFFDKPFLWWAAIPLIVAGLAFGASLTAWFLIRRQLRGYREHLDRAADAEAHMRARVGFDSDERR